MPTTDEQLVESIVQDGDSGLFRVLVERYQAYIFTLMYRSVGDRGTAEDLAQETFISVYRSIGSFRADAKFSTWLYRIAANVLHDELRRRKRRRLAYFWAKDSGDGERAEPPASPEDEPEQSFLRTEQTETIGRLFVLLPEKYRVILTMYYFNRINTAEIAAILSVPVKTVETRLARGRQRLKQLWTEEDNRDEKPASISRKPIGPSGYAASEHEA
ncbi:RNA polymerase sigma factor [Paenibacillus thermotolerans]|uniref:RNA polymerase sigma factor n=1 Tax=Paenibacillus thermotolerans TaxID=3027807 RepID=UPI002368F1CE|nr:MULTISPECIES: sigma-70 family RNA polymerase sigma factor [unclassified Paenibacillus]